MHAYMCLIDCSSVISFSHKSMRKQGVTIIAWSVCVSVRTNSAPSGGFRGGKGGANAPPFLLSPLEEAYVV